MSFFRDLDLTSIVERHLENSNLSKSELIQRACDEAATLTHASPYDQNLFFAVSETIGQRNFFNFQPSASLHFDAIGTDWGSTHEEAPSNHLTRSENRDLVVWREEIKCVLASNNTSRGLLALGQIHHDEGDCERAHQYFIDATKLDNNPLAFLELGFMHSPGGCKFDRESPASHLSFAFQCFEFAARNGVIEAYFPLAMAYWNGEGTERDEVKALNWLNKAHLAQVPVAKVFLAECLVDGRLGVTKDPQLAQKLLFDEALPPLEKSGSRPVLARAYYAGGYVRELGFSDFAGAVALYERAVEHGFSGADIYFRLFVTYKDVLKPANLSRALHFLQLSANQNNPHALFNLAKFHLDGTIEMGNESKALNYLIKHSKIQYAADCAEKPGLERGLANYLLGTMKSKMG